MTLAEQIERMSQSERIEAMELLWEALARDGQVQPPAWHEQILQQRQDCPESQYKDWQSARKAL